MLSLIAACAERRIMSRLSSNENPYIVKLHFAFKTAEYYALAMEFVPGGDLFSLVRGIGRMDEATARIFLAQLVLSLEFLHSKGIIHRKAPGCNFLYNMISQRLTSKSVQVT
jgi:serine/threonine protein kinase